MNQRREPLPAVGLATLVAMLTALYLALLWAPQEITMGPVQRIFYFHVAAAATAFLAFGVVFVCSIAYLRTGARQWDRMAYAAAEIGVLFTTAVLITGPLWARPVWNVWWTWDPRLTTTLVLWFLYIGYLFIRASAGSSEKEARLSAAFGILAFLDVPIVFFSARWWRSIHPTVIQAGKINMEPAMTLAMLAAIGAFALLFIYLLMQRVRLEKSRDEVEAIRNQLIGG
ncbi:MAG: cytochrome c biogenesis protein [Bacillota bacterium]